MSYKHHFALSLVLLSRTILGMLESDLKQKGTKGCSWPAVISLCAVDSSMLKQAVPVWYLERKSPSQIQVQKENGVSDTAGNAFQSDPLAKLGLGKHSIRGATVEMK